MGDDPLYRSNYLNVDPWPFESGEVAAGQNQLQGLADRARAWFAPGEAARAGIPGKILGTIGLDDSGARAATSWGDAAKHSVLSMVGHGFVEGIAGQGQRLMDGSRYATMGGVSRGEDEGMGPAGLMTAAALPMGSAIASRVAPGVARDAARVYSNPSEASPLALLQAGRENKGITAYHGSPHDFDRFSMDKIGTGEGAQAYGHGLYFAEKEGVAKQYRDALAPPPKRMIDDTGNPTLNNVLGITGGDVARARQTLANDVADGQKRGRPAVVSRAQSALDRLEELDRSGKFPSPEKSPGHMYEVRINADPEHFLDWDKPLSQQSEKVRDALAAKGMGSDPGRPELFNIHSDEGNVLQTHQPIEQAQRYLDANPGFYTSKMAAEGALSAQEIVKRAMGGRTVDPVAASNALRDAGIPGIRYLDQGSRTAGEGSRNYVVFNDKIIDIVKKYGIAAAASMYGFSRVNEAMAGGQDAAPQNALAPYSIP